MEYKKATEFTIKATTNFVPSETIMASAQAAKFARQFYFDDISIYESAFILLLNQANKVIGWAKIAQGGISSTIVDIRLVAKYAIDALATSVIFIHNHPSGNMVASPQDLSLCKHMKEGLKTLDVRLVDAIIIGPEENLFYSLSDNGVL